MGVILRKPVICCYHDTLSTNGKNQDLQPYRASTGPKKGSKIKGIMDSTLVDELAYDAETQPERTSREWDEFEHQTDSPIRNDPYSFAFLKNALVDKKLLDCGFSGGEGWLEGIIQRNQCRKKSEGAARQIFLRSDSEGEDSELELKGTRKTWH